MDWKIFTATFMTIFIAEIGDKTQFAAMAASSQTKSTMTVLIATIAALSLAAIIGVFAGAVLSKYVTPDRMKYISGVAFIIMGTWVLLKPS